jgi:hypothetical protein
MAATLRNELIALLLISAGLLLPNSAFNPS